MSVDHSLLEFLKNKRTTFANYQPIVIKLLLEKGVNENFSASIDEIKEKIILLNFDREDFQIKNAIDAVLPALKNYILEKDGFVSLNEDSFSNDDIDECLTICNKEIAKRHVTKIMEDKNDIYVIQAGLEGIWLEEFKKSKTVGVDYSSVGGTFDLTGMTKDEISAKTNGKAGTELHNISQLKKGDIVAIRSERELASFGIVTGNYFFDSESQTYPHKVNIEYLDFGTNTISGIHVKKAIFKTIKSREEIRDFLSQEEYSYFLLRHNVKGTWQDDLGKKYHFGRTVPNHIPLRNAGVGTKTIWFTKENKEFYFWGYGSVNGLETIQENEEWNLTYDDFKFFEKSDDSIEYRGKFLKRGNSSIKQQIENLPKYNKQTTMFKITKKIYQQIIGEDLTSKDDELDTMSMDNYDRALKWKPNLILYGPPGTGKTYHASKIAEKIISENLNIRYQNNDIQKMSDDEYLEFVISSLKQEAENNGYVMIQERQNIILKKENHKIHLRITTSSSDTGDPVSCYCGIDDNTIDFLKKASENDRYIVTINHSQKNFVVLPYSIQQSNASFAGGDTWDPTGKTAHSYHIRIDENSIILSGTNYDCTKFMRNIQGIFQNNSIFKVTFHPSYSYEDFVEGFRPNTDKKSNSQYVLEKGIFWKACETAKQYPNDKVVLIIDEINRGNIPKILGELITLIEKDKRSKENSLKLTYSKDDFFVPENLIIIGTMNTADKSLMQMDDALKRRFVFEELMPDTDVLLEHLKEKNIAHAKNYSQILKRINEKILGKGNGNESERMKQFRDRQIGHSYFWDLANDDDLQTVMKYDIIPLLQDYFYGDYNEIRKILGKGFDGKDATIIGEDNRPTELVNDKSKNTQLKEKLLEI